MMRSSVGSREARVKYKEPLFPNFDQAEPEEETSLQGDDLYTRSVLVT